MPLAVLLAGLLILALVSALKPEHFDTAVYQVTNQAETYSNVKEIGAVLYTEYVYPFELAAVLLLVAIIAAVSLAFRGKRPGGKSQHIAQQVAVNPKDRVRLVNIPTEKK